MIDNQDNPEGDVVPASLETLIGIAAPPIGWVMINNPARRNAMSRAMWDAMPRILDAFRERSDIRVLIFKGVGGKAFVSGADISEFEQQRSSPDAEAAYTAASQKAFGDIASFHLPTLAMIEGACVGGGLATALSCDMRIAARGSRFGIPAAKLGIGYPLSGIEALVALVGPAQARQLLYTAELVSGETALRIGLINELTEPESLAERVSDIAGMIARNAPLSQKAAKTAIAHVLAGGDAASQDEVQAAIDRAMNSADIKEGHYAFLEKRAPNFTGN
ncbi:MAG: enoyl-CoA hydratase [Ponticaulis sp.]|nr:enoyl-CoA hydratase [Ponticaulis sp.]